MPSVTTSKKPSIRSDKQIIRKKTAYKCTIDKRRWKEIVQKCFWRHLFEIWSITGFTFFFITVISMKDRLIGNFFDEKNRYFSWNDFLVETDDKITKSIHQNLKYQKSLRTYGTPFTYIFIIFSLTSYFHPIPKWLWISLNWHQR